MIPEPWFGRLEEWARGRYADVETIIRFFERAFAAASAPDRAWFGVHRHGATLVTGRIYLAALQSAGRDRGLWLLLDDETALPTIPGLDYRPVKSTKHLSKPLRWGHAVDLAVLRPVLDDEAIWCAFQRGSRRILDVHRYPMDATHEAHGKVRLSELVAVPVYRSADELPGESRTYVEGAVIRIVVNRYERDPEARRAAIARWGTTCVVCEVPLMEIYGPLAEGLVHVHHVVPIALRGGTYQIDPERDLRPLCPNCHAVVHYGAAEPRSIDDLRDVVRRRRERR